MKLKIILVYFLAMFLSSSAQKAWSLQDCFNHAIENNISIQKMALNEEYAKNNYKQNKLNIILPNINATISESFNFGNSIDPTTYQYSNNNTNSTRFSLSLNYNLFEGLSRINKLKSSNENLKATELEVEELKNNTKIAIANMYLQIVIANEVLVLAKENKSLTENQHRNTNELIKAGVLAKGNLLDLDAQLAQNDLSIINAESNLERSLNQLKLLLHLNPYSKFGVQKIKVPDNLSQLNYNPQNITNSAVQVLPEMNGAKYRLSAAEYDLKAAKGSLWPTLSISAYVGTNYFSAAQEVVSTTTTYSPIDIKVNGIPATIEFPNQNPNFEKTNFGKQFQNNLSENISLNLNIPILAAWQRRTAISNAKLNILNTKLDIDSKEQKLNEDVFNAYTDLKIAFKKFEATAKNIKASNLAYSYAQQKHKAGLLNALEFERAKNRKIAALAEQLQAKYEYVFRTAILKYYNTGKLTF